MTDSTTDGAYDTTERVDEYQDGVRLHVRSKRGTGTRDEDEVSGGLHADTIEELEVNRAQLREHVVDVDDHVLGCSVVRSSTLGGGLVVR